MENYELLSESVIKKDTLYFTKGSSADCIERKLLEQDSSYELNVESIDIQMKNNTVVDGIKFTFGCETEKGLWQDRSMFYVDLIVSDVLGTFISDRY